MRIGAALALALSASPAAACAIDPYLNSPFPESLAVDADSRGDIVRAWFAGPSTIYDHLVLGRDSEPALLFVQHPPDGTDCGAAIAAGDGRVFEDIAPRLHDLNGDGTNEVIVVRSHIARGAQLAVYGVTGGSFALLAATAPAGAPYRWLAPAGVGDFDGDGRVEIAWVQRPHADRVLVIGRLEGARITEIARAPGFSNHRIGEDAITGTVRRCGNADRLVLPDADWQRWQEVQLDGGKIAVRDAGPVARAPGACGT